MVLDIAATAAAAAAAEILGIAPPGMRTGGESGAIGGESVPSDPWRADDELGILILW